MNPDKRMALNIGGLEFESPLFIASGVWPMDSAEWPDGALNGVGGFCTKGLTLRPKRGNPGIRVWETPCGVMNSIGLQNPGIKAFLEQEYRQLEKAGKPVIFNLSFETEEELLLLLGYIMDTAGNVPVELNVSCPNVSKGGLSWAQDVNALERVVTLAKRNWKGLLWVKLSPNVSSFTETALAAEKSGADAVVVANTWLGTAIDVSRLEPVFDNIHAGLSGPAVFPLTLRLVWETYAAVKIPVIASGGVCTWQDAASMIAAGASAVQVGSALFSDILATAKMYEGLSSLLEKRNIGSVADLTGIAHGRRRDTNREDLRHG